MNTAYTIDPASNPKLEHNIQAFLKVLNSGEGKPLEQVGDFATHERFVRDLVSDSEFTSVFVSYTRSPEAQYPTAVNEAYAAKKWVAAHGDEINVDGKRLAVIGNSAGGNIATVTALRCKLEGGPALKAQVLFCPGTDANLERASDNEYADGYMLTKKHGELVLGQSRPKS